MNNRKQFGIISNGFGALQSNEIIENAFKRQSSLKKIAILFGGCSSEYQVSLKSAYAVISHINTKQYAPILIGITRSGAWYVYDGPIKKISDDTWFGKSTCVPVVVSPNQKLHGILILKDNKIQHITLDAALPLLHGKNGEDGTVQGVLELAGVPVIGCNTLSSELCIDKEMAHRVVSGAGILVPKSVVLTTSFDAQYAMCQAKRLGFPLFVKPVRAGSSFGITKVNAPKELIPAVKAAFEHDSRVLLEQTIDGFEVGCAILGTEQLVTGQLDEIELTQVFFDYTQKYTLQASKIYVPARISEEKAQEVKQTAINIYRALGCSCFARVDMFLSSSGQIYFNEVNTIPGFTVHSRYPNMLRGAGLSFEELVQKLIETAVTP